MLYLLKGKVNAGQTEAKEGDTLFLTGEEMIELSVEEETLLVLIETTLL